VLHSENGILGMQPLDPDEPADPDLIDAAKQPVSLRLGGSYVSHADSFAMIRGGHIDVSVMGALQVSAAGDLANWWDGSGLPGVGGAMDLAASARRVFVMMRHAAPDGTPKIVAECSAPLTAPACVDRIFTDYGIFEPDACGRIHVRALSEGIPLDTLQQITGVPLVADDDMATIANPRRVKMATRKGPRG